jgi:hypothetical protein
MITWVPANRTPSLSASSSSMLQHLSNSSLSLTTAAAQHRFLACGSDVGNVMGPSSNGAASAPAAAAAGRFLAASPGGAAAALCTARNAAMCACPSGEIGIHKVSCKMFWKVCWTLSQRIPSRRFKNSRATLRSAWDSTSYAKTGHVTCVTCTKLSTASRAQATVSDKKPLSTCKCGLFPLAAGATSGPGC